MNDRTVSENTIVIERTFDAPVEIVWQLWTQPEHFKNWYGPQGFTVPVAEMDLRVGGKRLVCMVSPDGSMKMWTTGEYLEVIPNQRLVYTEAFSDEHGNMVSSADSNSNGNLPDITKVTIELHDLGGRTKMVMTHAGVPSNAQGANEGWRQAFNKLAQYLESVTN